MNVKKAAALTTQCLTRPGNPRRDGSGRDKEHAIWMLQGISQGYIEGDKAHRWLGYAQALLVCLGDTSLDVVKALNKKAKEDVFVKQSASVVVDTPVSSS